MFLGLALQQILNTKILKKLIANGLPFNSSYKSIANFHFQLVTKAFLINKLLITLTLSMNVLIPVSRIVAGGVTNLAKTAHHTIQLLGRRYTYRHRALPTNFQKFHMQHSPFTSSSSNFSPSKIQPPFNSLILSGGGAKGAGYSGVVRQLEQWGVTCQLDEIIGSSIGAIVAIPLSLGLPAAEIINWMSNSNAKFCYQTMTDQLNIALDKSLGEHVHVIADYLAQQGHPLIDDNQQIVRQASSARCLSKITFLQQHLLVEACKGERKLLPLKLKDLIIIGSVEKSLEIEFSAKNTPNVSIATAAIASASFPRLMKPVVIPAAEFRESPVPNKSHLAISDAYLTNNFPFIYANGNRQLLVTTFLPKRLLLPSSNTPKPFSVQAQLSIRSFFYGFDLAQTQKHMAFDLKTAFKTPKVNILPLSVAIKFDDFKTGHRTLEDIERDTATQTDAFLADLQNKTSPSEALSSESKHLTKKQYLELKYRSLKG